MRDRERERKGERLRDKEKERKQEQEKKEKLTDTETDRQKNWTLTYLGHPPIPEWLFLTHPKPHYAVTLTSRTLPRLQRSSRLPCTAPAESRQRLSFPSSVEVIIELSGVDGIWESVEKNQLRLNNNHRRSLGVALQRNMKERRNDVIFTSSLN